MPAGHSGAARVQGTRGLMVSGILVTTPGHVALPWGGLGLAAGLLQGRAQAPAAVPAWQLPRGGGREHDAGGKRPIQKAALCLTTNA